MKRYGLLGRTLGHSYSPMIHGMLGDYSYELFAMEEEAILPFLSRSDLAGINVTIPYKKTVMSYCDEISDQALRIGCVNTILFKNGRLIGHNTDYDGFAATLDSLNADLQGKKVLILGRGATSQTVETVCRDRGAREIVKAGRDTLPHNPETGLDAEVLINCTPVGMYPNNGQTLVSLKEFLKLGAVIDVVYNPHRTKLLLEARELGISYADGLVMLAAQAIRASELFQEHSIPKEKLNQILQAIRRETENIVLIGMPGSGKSTVGQELAKSMNRKFVDTDEETEKIIGMSIPDYFLKFGEAPFRAVEKSMVEQFGKESGLILSTGGGVIKDPGNYGPLAQNGRIYYLERAMEELATRGRPLSAGGANLAALLAEREPLYRRYSDVVIKNTELAETCAGIREDFYENCHN